MIRLFQLKYKKIFIYCIFIFFVTFSLTYSKKIKNRTAFIIKVVKQNSFLRKTKKVYQSWIAEQKKYKVGDLITINLIENIHASNSAQDNFSRNQTNNFGLLSLLKNSIQKLFELQKNPMNFSEFDMNERQSFSNQDNAFAKNTITGTITGIIRRILPNGYLKVLGKKSIKINSSIENIYFSGIINPENLDKNNFISSTHIANCKIHYKYHHATDQRAANLQTIKTFLRSVVDISIKMFYLATRKNQ